MSNHSGGGTPKKNAMWLRQLARFAEGENREFKAEELNRVATEIEHAELELSAARSALAEKERELESLRAFKRGVDEALNSGDGVYRP